MTKRIKNAVNPHILRESDLLTIEALLHHIDHPNQLKRLSLDDLSQIVGSFTEAKQLHATLQLAHLLSNPGWQDTFVIRMPRDAYQYCKEKIKMCGDCQTVLLSLNTKNHITGWTQIESKVMNDIPACQRFIFRQLILRNAASGILVKMQKAGDIHPTPEQITMAKAIAEAAEVCGIPILDVINQTDSDFLSFKERGWI
ncbi:JAB domain-containing protein [Brevibacillus fulvus]|uniref:DNA repair protein RadC n=1 Tax=Brevibacillus fulvus TaxID=1125967 RepID=A0A938XX74_9BACL|nr:JAB domain-containing protein [Brevibacillus fulvus]MBM7592148.1 DNA repair protein RadC [Brevibacillus fulvus]